ncbi:AcrR family transcriptional regulator [Sphingobium sp. OAS761]|uniref:TetR/AcrR family transcriptional regulator n=1 Tax=Sphingobium sp. OAS761 TaxID=2817901 RepID=UPI0020A0F064|nr:TetR/AcrR family transcriptional regulator [Sphingobium sp. OAS761]MCP1470298.1 AcrR family transcriptional regulator [Sphingobium sp. OAS761]
MTKSSALPTFTPRRGRPNAAQTAAIEQTILATARAMFFEEGYDTVTMENVAARAGVSKGTLYARYPSKEALFTAIVDENVHAWAREASQRDHLLTDDIGDRLRHHGHTIAKSLTRPDVQAFQRLVFANAERFPELARAMHDIGYLHIVGLIAADIAAAAQRDGRAAKAPDEIARMFVSTLIGRYVQEGTVRAIDDDDWPVIVERIVALFLAGRDAW